VYARDKMEVFSLNLLGDLNKRVSSLLAFNFE